MAIEKNKLDLIDKEYLKNTIIDLDKDFLTKKYFLKNNGNDLTNKIKKIVGEKTFDSLNSKNYDNGLLEDLINKSKASKYYIQEDELPNPNDADENGFYLILDKNSIDEKNKFFVYTVIKQNNLKTWAIVSSPSVIFETENLDFKKEFRKYERKYTNSNNYCFYNWNELLNYIKTFNQNNIIINNINYYGYSGELQYNGENNYELATILYVGKNDELYIRHEDLTEYILYTEDRNELAHKIINNSKLGGDSNE